MKFYRVLFDDIINYYSKEKVKLNHIYEKDNVNSYFIYGYINKNDVCEEILKFTKWIYMIILIFPKTEFM